MSKAKKKQEPTPGEAIAAKLRVSSEKSPGGESHWYVKWTNADGSEIKTPEPPPPEPAPVPMIIHCPGCGKRHIDDGAFATKPHHTHACQCCGVCWRPAVVATVGVQFLPGFKDQP